LSNKKYQKYTPESYTLWNYSTIALFVRKSLTSGDDL